jgi:hypothetical protein
MHMNSSLSRSLITGMGLLALGSGGMAQSREPQTLAVVGATNATPSLAVAGRSVAAVWTAAKEGKTDVYLSMSTDAGATFSPPRRVNDREGDAGATNEQPPRVVISGAGGRDITVVWSKRDTAPQDTRRDIIRMARSTDGGRTFSPARITHDPTVSGARGWQALALGPNAVVHALWLDGREANNKIASMAHAGTPHKGQPPQEIYYGTLAPNGRTIETRIADEVCFCCKTAIAVDTRGGVYTAWRHVFPGSMRDIAFAKSSDGGRHFEPLVRVSQDNWQLNGCPEDGPAMAVDRSGTIHIAWATLVGDAEPYKAVFYASSVDGKRFSPRVRVPTDPMITPGHPQLTLTSNGGVAIVFDESMGSARRISLARIARTGQPQTPVVVLSGAETASHPVIVETTPGQLLVAWTSRSASSSEPSTIRVRRIS